MPNLFKSENRINNVFKRFFYHTFRPRGVEDYKEFLTRGAGGENNENAVYPWVYARVFVLFLCIFALMAATSCFSNLMTYPTVLITGAAFTNITALTLAYELYPKRDLAFLQVIIIMLAGMAVSVFIIDVGYYLFNGGGWTGVVWTAGLEETSKAIAAILLIVLFKNRNPLFGFVAGAAVGAGMSVSEDMGYIFWRSHNVLYPDYPVAVEVAAVRCGSSFFTHLLWTGFIGWAYLKFKKPLINFKFWGICLFSAALHFLWDMPIAEGLLIAVYILCSFAAAAFTVFAVLKPQLKKGACLQALQLCICSKEYSNAFSAKHNKTAKYRCVCNVTFALNAVILSVLLLTAIYINPGYRYESMEFDSAEKFVNFVHSGMVIPVNYERRYSHFITNSSELYEDGKLVAATQKVTDGVSKKIIYFYDYVFLREPHDDEDLKTQIVLRDVRVLIDGLTYIAQTIYTPNQTVKFFMINSKLRGYASQDSLYISYKNGKFKVQLREQYYYGKPWLIGICSAAGASVCACAAVVITMKIKIRRNKND